MSKPIIYVSMWRTETALTFLTEPLMDKLQSLGEVIWEDDLATLDEDARLEALRPCTIMVGGWGQPTCDEAYLDQLPSLQFIAYTAGSVAHVGTEETYKRGIRVSSGNKIFALSVAEATLAYMFTVLRRLPHYDQRMKQGLWREETFDAEGLFDKRISLVGFGTIARYLVPMLAPFHCKVSAYDPFVSADTMAGLGVTPIDLDACFVDHDIVSVHLPLNPGTKGLIDDRRLSLMNHRAILINTARGAVLDEEALVSHLQSGHIRAALDVFVNEPLPVDHPLRTCPNVVLVPHMAGPTIDRRPKAAKVVLEDIERFLNGEPLEHEILQTQAAMMTQKV